MALIFALTGKARLLNLGINKAGTSMNTMKLKLFTNDYTPVKGSVPGSFTEYAATGYAAVDFDPANITVTNDVGGTGQVDAVSTKITFTMTDAGSPVYGYYLTDSAGTILIGGERFSDAPYTLGSSGGTIGVTITLTLI